jgi:D-alanine-D-alanine ligase
MGSSVGISKVEKSSDLRTAIEMATKYDSRILIEQGVVAREVEVAVLGNAVVQTSLPGEVIKDVAFYDYKAKYIDNQITMSIPAKLPENVIKTLRRYSEIAYRAVAGVGLSRCDFFVTADEKIYLNEINAIPGFTPFSMYPLLWENMGLAYSELIEKLVDLALEAFVSRENKLRD